MGYATYTYDHCSSHRHVLQQGLWQLLIKLQVVFQKRKKDDMESTLYYKHIVLLQGLKMTVVRSATLINVPRKLTSSFYVLYTPFTASSGGGTHEEYASPLQYPLLFTQAPVCTPTIHLCNGILNDR